MGRKVGSQKQFLTVANILGAIPSNNQANAAFASSSAHHNRVQATNMLLDRRPLSTLPDAQGLALVEKVTMSLQKLSAQCSSTVSDPSNPVVPVPQSVMDMINRDPGLTAQWAILEPHYYDAQRRHSEFKLSQMTLQQQLPTPVSQPVPASASMSMPGLGKSSFAVATDDATPSSAPTAEAEEPNHVVSPLMSVRANKL
ncbi:hypothetical protein N0V94_002232 [Neodidymelliopsis sp. IMI 364377]|nr:hypothetical protein N0V94_002232 [Neodidymelliopsis sp. IMI 364377]